MLNELNHVIDYIEDHLTDDLSLEIISEYAGVPDYHFRKIFYYLSGLTLSEYIKNRRLSEANKDLLNGEKVTDVAYKYGYQSMDGFTRAFYFTGNNGKSIFRMASFFQLRSYQCSCVFFY